MQLVPSHVLPLHTEWKRLVVQGSRKNSAWAWWSRSAWSSQRCCSWVGLTCHRAVLGPAGCGGKSRQAEHPPVSTEGSHGNPSKGILRVMERPRSGQKTQFLEPTLSIVPQADSFKLSFTSRSSSSFQQHLGQISQPFCSSFSSLPSARRCQTAKEPKRQALSFPQKGACLGPIMGSALLGVFIGSLWEGALLSLRRCRKNQAWGVWISKTGSSISAE